MAESTASGEDSTSNPEMLKQGSGGFKTAFKAAWNVFTSPFLRTTRKDSNNQEEGSQARPDSQFQSVTENNCMQMPLQQECGELDRQLLHTTREDSNNQEEGSRARPDSQFQSVTENDCMQMTLQQECGELERQSTSDPEMLKQGSGGFKTSFKAALQPLLDFSMNIEFWTKGHKDPKLSDIFTKRKDGKIVIQIPVVEEWKNDQHKVRKCIIGKEMQADRGSRRRKNLIILGATGSGKSTFIDGLMNYVLGVTWEDKYHVNLINLTEGEKKRKHAGSHLSQTDWVTIYNIPTDETTTTSVDLGVIDTPGFGDTRGIAHDEEIVAQIEYLFRHPAEHGIDCIDAICIIVQSTQMRLTSSQRYIFDQILSLFGKDVAENIFIMVTFADADRRKPVVIETLKQANVPFAKYFKFNNLAFKIQEKDDNDFDCGEEYENSVEQLYWKIGLYGYQHFLGALAKVEPKSLTLTKSVLQSRERLKCDLGIIQEKIKQNTHTLARIEHEKTVLDQNEANIKANKDFEYEVEEEKMERIFIKEGVFVTNCCICHETCHDNCAYADNKDKHKCCAMTDGKCRNCKNKCDWSDHYNNGYIFKLVVKKVKGTYEGLKKRYDLAKEGKVTQAKILSKLADAHTQTEQELALKIKEARLCLMKLREIALKPDPLTETDYIDMLIEDERRQGDVGFPQRIEQLQKLKKRAQLLKEKVLTKNVK